MYLKTSGWYYGVMLKWRHLLFYIRTYVNLKNSIFLGGIAS